MEDDSLNIIINSYYSTNLNETAFFFLYITFSQLFPFTEMIRDDKNDLFYLAVLLFLVAVYAHHQQNQRTLLACWACWPQCMIAVRVKIGSAQYAISINIFDYHFPRWDSWLGFHT